MKRFIPLLICALMASGSALAETSWKEANHAIVKEHVIPRYQQLADAGNAMKKSSQALCTLPTSKGLERVRKNFHKVMDGWAGVQHLRTGPIELFDRYHRFQLWPDKHNTGNKQLNRLLAEKQKDALRPARFAQSSVAVQGLSALERLLYGKDKSVRAFMSKHEANYRCQLVMAISHNIADMSRGLVEDWKKDNTFEQLFISGGGMSYELKLDQDITARKEITTVFFNNLYTQVQSVIDQKLLRPLGKGKKVKARYLESWRSLRSLRNIELNLQALESLYDTGFASALQQQANGTDVHKQIKQAFKATVDAAAEIDGPLYKVLKDQRPAVENLMASTRKLQSLLTGPLPEALDIEMGFNALDGD